jgi:hypothetical protein
MIRNLVLATILGVGTPLAVLSADAGDAATTSRLGASKHTLVDAIRQVEKANGSAISAKFEFEDGKLWLSVYAAKSGRAADAEHNTLIELKGEPNAAAWKPAIEVFSDKEHLTRSAMQLTLMQQSKAGLADLVMAASTTAKGTIYSAIPAVRNGSAVLVVLTATPDGKTHSTDIELR